MIRMRKKMYGKSIKKCRSVMEKLPPRGPEWKIKLKIKTKKINMSTGKYLTKI